MSRPRISKKNATVPKMLQDFANKWAPLASQDKQIELIGDVMKIAAEFCDSFVQEKLLEQTKETGVLQ